MLPREQFLLIIYFIVVIFVLTAFGILFFLTFQKRKNKLLYEKFEAEKRFEQEITRSRFEIQEQTLKNIGWELHDNIGQLLSVANMKLNVLASTVEGSTLDNVKEVKEVVGNSMQEVRALSRSLNNEVIDYAGLEASVQNELFRFERLNILETEIKISGNKFEIPQKAAIIIFRIIQEFFSNVLKHSKANAVLVEFHYLPTELVIVVRDNGEGFNMDEVEKSSGLINMESRAQLIGAGYELISVPAKGTSLTLQYPVNYEKNCCYSR